MSVSPKQAYAIVGLVFLHCRSCLTYSVQKKRTGLMECLATSFGNVGGGMLANMFHIAISQSLISQSKLSCCTDFIANLEV